MISELPFNSSQPELEKILDGVVKAGEKIIERPVEYKYLPVSSDVIRRMSVWLTDQDQRPLNLREENLTIRFHLRSC